MNRILNVHLLPDLADPHGLAGHTAIVIDVLRASTTITTALHRGAEKFVPCMTVEEARQLAAERPGALLGGERKGKPLPGFDFGNSPAEYTRDRVAGKTIVFTTTNGTMAMTRCMGSGRILIGAIVNRRAVCRAVSEDQRVDIVCAGTNGEFSLDDALGAGAIVHQLLRQSSNWLSNDAAEICRCLWRSCNVDEHRSIGQIEESLAKSIGGKNLIAIGMRADLSLAAEVDICERVPELDKSVWEIG